MKELRNMTKKEVKKIEKILEKVQNCILDGYHEFYYIGSHEHWF